MALHMGCEQQTRAMGLIEGRCAWEQGWSATHGHSMHPAREVAMWRATILANGPCHSQIGRIGSHSCKKPR